MWSDGIEVIGFAKYVIIACYRGVPNFLRVLHIGKFKSKESKLGIVESCSDLEGKTTNHSSIGIFIDAQEVFSIVFVIARIFSLRQRR